MKIQIGLRHGGGQLAFETNLEADQLRQEFEAALKSNDILDFTDARGERAFIPADSIAFFLIPAQRDAKVGFGRD